MDGKWPYSLQCDSRGVITDKGDPRREKISRKFVATVSAAADAAQSPACRPIRQLFVPFSTA